MSTDEEKIKQALRAEAIKAKAQADEEKLRKILEKAKKKEK